MSLNHIYAGSPAFQVPIQASAATISGALTAGSVSTSTLSLSTLINGLGVITGPSGRIEGTYPVQAQIPLTDSYTLPLAYVTTGATTDLFTVPAGYYAMWQALFFNGSGTGGMVINASAVNGGTAYITQQISGGLGNNTNLGFIASYAFQPGETCRITTVTVLSGLTIIGTAILWPTATTALTPIAFKGMTDASNVVYTVPEGKVALPVGTLFGLPVDAGAGRICNGSATTSAFTVDILQVSSGQTLRIMNQSITAGAATGPPAWYMPLGAGDQIIVGIPTAGSRSANNHFWLNMLVLNASDFPFIPPAMAAMPRAVHAAIPGGPEHGVPLAIDEHAPEIKQDGLSEAVATATAYLETYERKEGETEPPPYTATS